MNRLQTGALALLAVAGIFAGGYAVGARGTASPHAIVSADSLRDSIVASDARSLPRLQQTARTVARATERQAAATSHHDSAAVLGQAAARLTDSLSCTDTTMLRRLGELHAGEMSESAKSLRDWQTATGLLRGELNYVRDTLLVERTTQRDEAMRQLDVSVHANRPRRCGLGIAAGWGIKGPDAVAGVSCRL